jgi:putative ATPase
VARERLIGWADGDARRLLNAVEIVADAASAQRLQSVDGDVLESAMSQNLRRFDKGGDAFYDQISALHKSVRGSHPDAALYWFARMIDIGNADPRALALALDAAETYERLGSPEGELALAQALVFLASAPKSNAVYEAWNAALAHVRSDASRPVPEHLRNAPTRLMKQLGYGQRYRYAHDEPDAYAAGETYLPDGMAEPRWYQPVPRGLEIRIAEKLERLRQLDREAGGSPHGNRG